MTSWYGEFINMSRSTGASSSHHFVELTCSLCTGLSVKFNIIGDYIKHLRLFHAHRPDFKVTCGIDGCLRSYNNLGSFKNHISFVHNTVHDRTSEGCAENNREVEDEVDQDITNDISPEFDSGDDSLTSDEDIISGYDTPHFDEDRHIPSQIPAVTRDETNAVNEINSDDIPTWTAKDLQKYSAQFLFGIKERYKLTQVATQGIIQGTASITQQCIAALKSKVCT